MKPKIAFFGSDQYSTIVWQALSTDKRFISAKAPPARLPLAKICSQVKKYRPDVGVLASYGKILSQKLLNVPKHGIFNIHPSLLPQYRGPTPVPTAILNGDQTTGVSIIQMDEEVDHGPILAQFKMDIYPDDTSEKLLKRCFTAGAQVLLTILPVYLEGQIELRQQDHDQATYCEKLARDDGFIPPNEIKSALNGKFQSDKVSKWQSKIIKISATLQLCNSATFLDRFIRAMHPWPGAWTKVKVKRDTQDAIRRLKILQSHLEGKKLALDQVQLEGKKPVTWKQFLEGYPGAKLI